jgi:CheY-like chemotaxis protein
MAKILVIDDDALMRRLVGRILVGGGHDVIEAMDGRDGMVLFRTNRPDIVVTDLVMPQQDGIETIIKLRREDPAILILAISGGLRGSPVCLDAAQKLGADATLMKPFLADDLLGEIDKLLHGQMSRA